MNEKTLIVNSGSSSLKYRVYENEKVLLDECIEEIKDFSSAGTAVINKLGKYGLESIKKVVYRVVYGADIKSPSVIDDKLIEKMEQISSVAPLHMKNSINLIKLFRKKLNAIHIACFDNSFHKSIPEFASKYAIPLSISEKYGIKRNGFHGLSHESMLRDVEKIVGKKFERVITCQMGNGASVCAIRNGKSVDTSMGFTPLEGLMMGTRSGDIDPAIIQFICNKENKNLDEVMEILQKGSGFKGIAGESNVKILVQRAKKGDKKAELALDMFAYRVRKYIGAYISVLGGVDLIVLGGGISRAGIVRKKILSGLEGLGIFLDSKKINGEYPVKISKGKVQVWVMEGDEQKLMRDMSRVI